MKIGVRENMGIGHCRQNGVFGFGIAAQVIAPEHTYLQFMVTRSAHSVPAPYVATE